MTSTSEIESFIWANKAFWLEEEIELSVSESTRTTCWDPAIILSFTVVIRPGSTIKPSVDKFESRIIFCNSLPGASSPITEQITAVAPKLAIFKTTFPAPPKRDSRRITFTTGTGASGEILLTLPHVYESIIKSPIIKTFNRLNPLINSETDCIFYPPIEVIDSLITPFLLFSASKPSFGRSPKILIMVFFKSSSETPKRR